MEDPIALVSVSNLKPFSNYGETVQPKSDNELMLAEPEENEDFF